MRDDDDIEMENCVVSSEDEEKRIVENVGNVEKDYQVNNSRDGGDSHEDDY
jgi:hypothetical protein